MRTAFVLASSIPVGFLSLSLAASCGGGDDDLTFGTNSASSSSAPSSASSSGTGGAASSSIDASSSSAGGAGGAGGEGGAGGAGGSAPACDDLDGDGVTNCDGDCDDGDPFVRPGASEICGDGIANDCSGPTDPASCNGLGTFVATHVGDDTNPGTKEQPLATIQKALKSADFLNKQPVFVANGTYAPQNGNGANGTPLFALQEGISLYGGYRCDNTECTWARNPKVYVTRIEALDGWGVNAPSGITNNTVIEGFEIVSFAGGSNPTYGTVAVSIQGAPTVRGNRIVGSTANTGNNQGSFGIRLISAPSNPDTAKILGNEIVGGASVNWTYGIHIMGQARADIEGNDIRSGQAYGSRSVYVAPNAGAVKLLRNTIAAGGCQGSTAFAVLVDNKAAPLIDGNLINTEPSAIGTCSTCASANANNGADRWCGGIASTGSSATITNNVIYGIPSSRSAGILVTDCPYQNCQYGSATINSNTIHGGGQAGGVSAAVVWRAYRNAVPNLVAGRVRNNILLAGSGSTRASGWEDNAVGWTARPEKLENNDLWGSTAEPYIAWVGVPVGQPTIDDVNMMMNAQNNLSVDPALDASWHLTTDACVDAGTTEETPTSDRDGDARPKGMGFDVGADESK